MHFMWMRIRVLFCASGEIPCDATVRGVIREEFERARRCFWFGTIWMRFVWVLFVRGSRTNESARAQRDPYESTWQISRGSPKTAQLAGDIPLKFTS